MAAGSSTTPLVSVVVPTKDRPALLREALASIAAQSLRSVEAVVVDDAGRPVDDVVSEFAFARALAHDVNRGLAAARNTALGAARGSYIAYLDDDDVFLPNHLETLVGALERSGAALAYSDAVMVRIEDGVERGRAVRVSPDFSPDRLLYENLFPVICAVHRRDVVEACGLFDEELRTPLEDWEYWLRVSRAHEFLHVPEATVEVRERASGRISTGNWDAFRRNARLIFDRYAEHVADRPDLRRLQQGYLAGLDLLERRERAAAWTVSIVVPTYDNLELTRQCLAAIEATADVGFELVVVDNASTDGTREFLRAAEVNGRLRAVLNGENAGFARACNQGLALARGDAVLFLNNDTIPRPGWLSALVAPLAEEDVGVVGAKLLYADGTIQHAGVAVREVDGDPHPFHHYLCHPHDAPHVDRRRDLQMVTGACLLIRRELAERLGGFDEAYWNGHEDLDLCLRAREAGFRVVYEPRAVVTHLESQTKRLLGMENFVFRGGVENEEAKGRRRFLERWRDTIEVDEPRLRAEDGLVAEDEALHVLFAMFGWQHEGGGTILPRQIAKALVRRGHRVTVLSAAPERRPDLPAYALEQRVDEGVRVLELFNRPTVFYDPSRPEIEADDPHARGIVRELVAQLRPDVVHWHSLVGFSLAAPQDVHALGVPSVFTSHNYWPICPRMYCFEEDLSPCAAAGGSCACGPVHAARAATARESFATAVDRHLAVSRRVGELYARNGHDPERIVVLHQQPQTVDRIWREVGEARAPEPPLERPLRVGFVGSALPHKGVHVLAAALQLLPPGAVECTVFGGGTPQYLEALRAIDAAGALRFHGPYGTDELPALLRALDVCVVPSVWEDCAPLVVAEALAARLPVVGTDAGGIPDFVRDGVDGFLFPLGDANALADALRRFLDDPTLLGRMQAAIEPPQGFDAYLDELVGHYRDVIAARRRIAGARRFAVVASAGDVIRDASLLAGFASSFGAGDDATLVLHARGDEVEALERAIAAAGLDGEDGPDMLAIVDRLELAELEARADAVLRPGADVAALRALAETAWAA